MEAVGLFLGTLMQSRNQAHIYHLQVQGMGSFAAHKALRLSKFVETIRKQLPQDSYIQNEVDTVVKLIETTKYKLKFLQ